MKTLNGGRLAENFAAGYLSNLGYKIVEQNWRTRYCEIDIVVKKNSDLFFVEVKYRASSEYGQGLDYITPKKLSQMKYAAESWVQQHNYKGQYSLSALAITDKAVEFIETIEIA